MNEWHLDYSNIHRQRFEFLTEFLYREHIDDLFHSVCGSVSTNWPVHGLCSHGNRDISCLEVFSHFDTGIHFSSGTCLFLRELYMNDMLQIIYVCPSHLSSTCFVFSLPEFINVCACIHCGHMDYIEYLQCFQMFFKRNILFNVLELFN